MPCTKPLIRAETWETYTTKEGKKAYKTEWLQRDFYDQIKNSPNWNWWNGNKYRSITPIPCGQCLDCQLNYARQWATDCMLEKHYYPENECWFITLTYADEYLPIYKYTTEDGKEYSGISLRKKDFQDFWKRLRKHYKCKIKYLLAGEYGSQTQRPHSHAIVFGLPLNTTQFKYIGKNANGDALWTDPELEKVWGKGNIIIGQVTFKSVSYVVRYTIKKWKNKDSNLNKLYGRIDEFICMSQGIGKRYYEDNKDKIISQGGVITESGKIAMPKRFMRQIKKENSEKYENLKRRNQKIAEQNEIQRNQQTDLSPEERRQKDNMLKTKNFKDMRR